MTRAITKAKPCRAQLLSPLPLRADGAHHTIDNHSPTSANEEAVHIDNADRRRFFLVVEGGDGAGKTTTRKHVYRHLRDHGHDVLSLQGRSFHDPRHTAVITNARFHGRHHPPGEILRAHVGDREQLSDRILRPHLAWRHILCDRYVTSDIVYQSIMWDIDVRTSWEAYLASSIARPDLILFLDTPPTVAAERLNSRSTGGTFPWEELEVQKKVYSLFNRILFGAELPPLAPVLRVDNSGSLVETQQQVIAKVGELLAERAAR
jgi:dTMP kinase